MDPWPTRTSDADASSSRRRGKASPHSTGRSITIMPASPTPVPAEAIEQIMEITGEGPERAYNLLKQGGGTSVIKALSIYYEPPPSAETTPIIAADDVYVYDQGRTGTTDAQDAANATYTNQATTSDDNDAARHQCEDASSALPSDQEAESPRIRTGKCPEAPSFEDAQEDYEPFCDAKDNEELQEEILQLNGPSGQRNIAPGSRILDPRSLDPSMAGRNPLF